MYCFPAKWIWGPNGWLKNLGVIDNAGSGVVHLVAGFAGKKSYYILEKTVKQTYFPKQWSVLCSLDLVLGSSISGIGLPWAMQRIVSWDCLCFGGHFCLLMLVEHLESVSIDGTMQVEQLSQPSHPHLVGVLVASWDALSSSRAR